jgi:AcrR family transcriptional regulator
LAATAFPEDMGPRMGPIFNTRASNRPTASKNTTADRLLVAVSELMIERNSIEVSLSDLALKSGVNAALVKYHFGNKEGLLLALLARDAEAQISHVEYLLKQPISPTEKLKLHIAGIINAYYRFPYMNRLLHLLLHDSSEAAASSVSQFFIKPLLDFQRRLLDEGVAAGEFKRVDPVFFYTHLIGACDHLFHGRHAMSRAAGVGDVTDAVRRQYIDYMTDTLLGGLLCTGGKRVATVAS